LAVAAAILFMVLVIVIVIAMFVRMGVPYAIDMLVQVEVSLVRIRVLVRLVIDAHDRPIVLSPLARKCAPHRPPRLVRCIRCWS
jgi:hypothetical protein